MCSFNVKARKQKKDLVTLPDHTTMRKSRSVLCAVDMLRKELSMIHANACIDRLIQQPLPVEEGLTLDASLQDVEKLDFTYEGNHLSQPFAFNRYVHLRLPPSSHAYRCDKA